MTETKYEIIKVKIGSVGNRADYRKTYRFTGVEIAFLSTNDSARNNDDRGEDFTLYQCGDDKYRIHIKNWSRWQGESDFYRFVDPDLDDHDPDLGKESVFTLQQVYDNYIALYNEALERGNVPPIVLDLDKEESS